MAVTTTAATTATAVAAAEAPYHSRTRGNSGPATVFANGRPAPERKKMKDVCFADVFLFGTAGGTRTPDLLVRSQSLYPAELQAHFSNSFIIISSKVQYVNPFFKKTSNFLRKSYFSQKYLHRHFYCGIVCPKTLFVPFTPTRFHLGGVYYDRSYRI